MFDKISSHVCEDDRPFKDRIELEYIYFLRFIRAIYGMFRMLKKINGGISSYVVLDYLQERQSICRGSTCEVFHHCVSPGVDSNHKFERLHSCKDCICCAVRQCKFSDDFSND